MTFEEWWWRDNKAHVPRGMVGEGVMQIARQAWEAGHMADAPEDAALWGELYIDENETAHFICHTVGEDYSLHEARLLKFLGLIIDQLNRGSAECPFAPKEGDTNTPFELWWVGVAPYFGGLTLPGKAFARFAWDVATRRANGAREG